MGFDEGEDIVEDFAADDEDRVDDPGTCIRSRQRLLPLLKEAQNLPFAFTHSAFRFGSAWSLKCSIDSGGSVYMRLLDLLLLLAVDGDCVDVLLPYFLRS